MSLADAVIGQMKEPLIPHQRPETELPEKSWVVRGKGGGEQRIVKSLYLGDGELEAHNWKLHAKGARLKESETRWEEFRSDDAELLVVAFGSTARIAKTAIMQAREKGVKVGLLRPITLFPFPEKVLSQLPESCRKILVIELNTGQMVDDVRLHAARHISVDFYGRPPGAGSLPSPEELLMQIENHAV
jgi:2-oxoglutarate ferredoxin oxidoreductase subunit alpha